MEFHYGLWNGVSALYSDSGRQLGEENARPLTLNLHVPAETLTCKYAGSREGRQINISALRIAMQNFGPALAITEAVRCWYLDLLQPAHQLGIWDLNIIARASIALVAYQQRFTRQKPVIKTVSDALTSQYQFISGVFMICRHMMENADPLISKNQPLDAQTLYEYADKQGIFISFNGMACAGSTKKIIEFLDFCNQGGGKAADLTTIVTEPENWLRYALAAVELDCMIEERRAIAAISDGSDGSLIHEGSAQIHRDFGNYLHGLMDRETSHTTEDLEFEAAALERQNGILNLLARKKMQKLPRNHVLARIG